MWCTRARKLDSRCRLLFIRASVLTFYEAHEEWLPPR